MNFIGYIKLLLNTYKNIINILIFGNRMNYIFVVVRFNLKLDLVKMQGPRLCERSLNYTKYVHNLQNCITLTMKQVP